MIVYENDDVLIETVRIDQHESTVLVNGQNLIWISRETEDEFKRELSELLNKYRI